MALFPIYNFFVFNDEIKPVSSFVLSENEGGIYEVVRVVNKVPLFLNEHLNRFYQSAKIAGKKVVFSENQIEFFLKELIDQNKVSEGNILISCKKNLKAFFIPHNYPKSFKYATGVTCGVLNAERKNPNAKVFQTSVRQQADKMIAENGFYEVLLVDNEGRVTEGSRSNVFFVNKNGIITPPANEVLLGITRQKTIVCAKKNGVQVFEEDVYLEDLTSFDAAFITGTSPNILPIEKIGAIPFDAKNKVVQNLIVEYNLMVIDYIKNRLSQ